jgi:Sec-independent protein translocase protein TatA
MNDLLPILTWLSLWAAAIVFGFMIILYLFLMLMGKEELTELRKESDAVVQTVRDAEMREVAEKQERRAARRRDLDNQS